MPTSVHEQRIVVQPARDTGRRGDGSVEFGHGTRVPGEDRVVLHHVVDRSHRHGRYGAQVDVQRRGLRLQQPAQ